MTTASMVVVMCNRIGLGVEKNDVVPMVESTNMSSTGVVNSSG
jgi:hypothetical protein